MELTGRLCMTRNTESVDIKGLEKKLAENISFKSKGFSNFTEVIYYILESILNFIHASGLQQVEIHF